MKQLQITRNNISSNKPVNQFGTLNLYNRANSLPFVKQQKNIKTGGLMYDNKLTIKVGKF
tara:strand:- start:959 stop:1138 length:180 start_codon:yes stop_codon:yes gene_type:complete